jgi:hypothetical protein
MERNCRVEKGEEEKKEEKKMRREKKGWRNGPELKKSGGQLNLSQQENSLVGADLATVATNFAQAQVANQATLNATARVLGLPTLLDFLK